MSATIGKHTAGPHGGGGTGQALLSNLVKPDGLSLEEWQVALRAQAARRESLSVSEVDARHTPGLYRVYSAKSRIAYNVNWYGLGHQLNACSCMDFKTSRLGTCKHVEAVRIWVKSGDGRYLRRPNPSSSVLHMDYTRMPCPRIYYGEWELGAVREIFGPMTDAEGRFSPSATLRIPEAVRQAQAASPDFICRDEVMEFASRLRDDAGRRRRLEELLADGDWWKPLFVDGVAPYPYQLEGVAFAARAGRCIIADEMGLGKTIQSMGAVELLHREGYVSSALVICPTSLKYQWKHEVKAFCGRDAVVIEGAPHVRKGLYASPELFKIVSYNTFSNDVRELGDMSVDMVIMDEVQRLKNWNTHIARSARRLRSDYAIILSGTPLENKLEELYSIVQLADQYALGPYWHFRDSHILSSDSGKVLGYKGLNSIGKTLEGVLLRRSKADVSVQLPARMDQNLFVPMTREQMDIHVECKEAAARIVSKWRRMHFLSELDRKRLLTCLSRMRMVCDSTFVLDQKTRHDTKVGEVMDILDSILRSGHDKVVIFSGWERMTRLVADELDARGIGYSNLNGSVPSSRRGELIGRFTDDPEVRVFLSTDTGSAGLNLQSASYVINLDLPWNPAVLEQRIGRVYRLGQTRKVQVINLISVGTIEESMLSKLKFKADLFDGVLNGGEDSVFIEDGKLERIVEEMGLAPDGTFEEGQGTIPFVEDEPDALSAVPGDDADSAAEDLVRQGASFIAKLLGNLKDPASARALVDALVKEDPQTGQASINIPVSGKDAVLQVAAMIGKMLGKG